MSPLRDFFSLPYDGRPVLISGKGPSFTTNAFEEVNGNFYKVSLNHCIREGKFDFAHIIDFDVIKDCQQQIYDNCKYLVMPYHPHFGYRAVPQLSLAKIVDSNEFLKKMNEEGRLLAYNLSTAGLMCRVGSSPVVKARHYSAEAVVDLMAKWGVKTIRTLGVDGGSDQSKSFQDLPNLNKERGYDLQWKGIRKTIHTHKLDYAPIGCESPIRIFVGAGQQQLIPALVLKHSILKHATMSVEVTPMIDWKHPMPKDFKNWPRTPFSFQRFMIPEECRYQGHAIYMDSDMLVFGDVKEIWHSWTDFPITVMRETDEDKHKAQFSVVLFNCKESRIEINRIIDLIDKGLMSYEELVFKFDMGLDIGYAHRPDWNSLEEYTEGKTKLLHYTEMYNQPWLRNPNHPLGYLWFNELKEAVSDGSIDKALVADHVSKGWILPKCLEVLNG